MRLRIHTALRDFLGRVRRARLRRVLDENSAADPIIVLDAALVQVYASPTVCKVLGYGAEELIGRHVLESVHPEDRAALAASLAGLLSGVQPCSSTWRYRACRQGGGHIRVEGQGRLMQRRHEIVLTVRDISDQRHSQDRMREVEKMQAVGQLAAGVAHDFNNLLTVIMGNLELLSDDGARDTDSAMCITAAQQAGERAANLAQQLLSYAGLQILDPVAVDVAALLGDIRHLLRSMLPLGISIDTAVDAGLDRVYADRVHLRAALVNLALNAAQAMPQGGELCFEAYEASGDYDLPFGEYIVIAATDSGPGVSAEMAAHAFEPFFGGGRAAGSGLGLPMVRGFSRQSGGDTRIVSMAGCGSRIELWLPAIAAAAETAVSRPKVAGVAT